MIEFADSMIIGGGMSYTFVKKIHDVNIGDSLFDKEGYEHVNALLEKARQKGINIQFPVDINCGKEFKPDTESKIFQAKNGIDNGW
jgi:phosphoglycerate kinase